MLFWRVPGAGSPSAQVRATANHHVRTYVEQWPALTFCRPGKRSPGVLRCGDRRSLGGALLSCFRRDRWAAARFRCPNPAQSLLILPYPRRRLRAAIPTNAPKSGPYRGSARSLCKQAATGSIPLAASMSRRQARWGPWSSVFERAPARRLACRARSTAADAVLDVSQAFLDERPRQGRASIRAYWDQMWDISGGVRGDPVEVLDVGGGRYVVVVAFGLVGKLSGADVTGKGAMVYTLRDGLITRLDMFPDRERALEAVGLAE